VLVFHGLNVHAQESELFIGASSSLEHVDLTFGEGNNVSSRTNPELLGFSIMVDLTFNINRTLRVTSGIGYSQKGYEYGYNFIFNDPNDPFIPNKTSVLIHFVRVPFLVGFRIIKKRFDIIPSAGLQFEFLVKKTEKTIYEDGSMKESDLSTGQYASLWPSVVVRIAFEYAFHNKLKVDIIPFAYATSLSYDGHPDSRIITQSVCWGVKAGISYKL